MGWEIAWEKTLEDEIGSVGERNYRNVLAANTSDHNGTKIRITVQGGAGGASTIDGSSIGLMTANDDYDNPANGTFKRITWVDEGGGNAITVPAGESKVSDEITFTFDKTKRYGVHFYYVNRINTKYSDSNGDGFYYKAGAEETMNQVVAGYAYSASYAWSITKLEVWVGGKHSEVMVVPGNGILIGVAKNQTLADLIILGGGSIIATKHVNKDCMFIALGKESVKEVKWL